jgi:hypothetical protein
MPVAFYQVGASEVAGGQRQKGDHMFSTMTQNAEAEETAEQRLWRAVIAGAVEEWLSGPLRRKRDAEQYLFQDDSDFRTVCCSAGIDPKNLRDRLQKIRSRQEAEAQAPAPRN